MCERLKFKQTYVDNSNFSLVASSNSTFGRTVNAEREKPAICYFNRATHITLVHILTKNIIVQFQKGLALNHRVREYRME